MFLSEMNDHVPQFESDVTTSVQKQLEIEPLSGHDCLLRKITENSRVQHSGSSHFETKQQTQLLLLSSRGLADIADSCFMNDFQFIVNGKDYECNRICAAFVALHVARILRLDPSAESYNVDIDEPHDQFELIIQMAKGIPVSIDQSNGGFLYGAALSLGNREMLDVISNISLFDNGLSILNVVDRLIQRLFAKSRLTLNFLSLLSIFLTFLAKNWRN
jgi:hypothetical protein